MPVSWLVRVTIGFRNRCAGRVPDRAEHFGGFKLPEEQSRDQKTDEIQRDKT